MTYDSDRKAVTHDGGRNWIELAPQEHTLFEFLLARRGHIATYKDFQILFGWDYAGERQLKDRIYQLVFRLTNKIGDDMILAIRGYGYMLKPGEAQRCPTCGRIK